MVPWFGWSTLALLVAGLYLGLVWAPTVITSYSIHYTKLYDSSGTRWAGPRSTTRLICPRTAPRVA